ncbi:Riboflavin synthase alpha chain [Savitreella phatthalungensis]
MFTGLVEHLGKVERVDNADGCILSVEAGPVLDDVALGDSIAVNGTCLTVTSFTDDRRRCTFGVAPETLRRTCLGALKTGDAVNLERACKASTRMGGHLVQGHVDTVATITDRRPDGEAVALTFEPRDREILKYVVEKGYICLDGASLTVTHVDDATFSVMLITYTQEKITLGTKQKGEPVNVEVDQVGKYIERMITPHIQALQAQIDALKR